MRFLTRSAVILIASCALVGSACSSDGEPIEDGSFSVATVSESAATSESEAASAISVNEADQPPEPRGCAPDLSGATPPSPEEFAVAEALLSERMEQDNQYWNSLAPGMTSGYDRIAIELNSRNPEFIQSLLDLVDPDLLCFILPPAGYDDRPPERALWSLISSPDDDATTIDLLVEDMHDGCGHDPAGRVLPPEITYSETEIRIEITLENLLWGRSYDCIGFGPTEFSVELDEPVNGRALVGSGR